MALTLQAQIKWIDNVADFKKAVEDGTGALVAHTQKVEKLTQSLGGGGLLGVANNYTAAVERMGGVTKLTSAEQDRINTLLEKAIAKYDALGKTPPQALLDLYRATKQVSDATTEHSDALGRQESLLPGFIAKYIEARGIYDLARESYDAFTDLLVGSVEAYGRAEQAEERLVGGLRAVGQATPEIIDAYKRYAEELENTTVVSRAAALEAEGTFTLIGNVGPEMMQRALKATADFSAVTGKSFDDAALAIAKATDGNVTQLKRYGIEIDKSRIESEGIAAVFDAIEKKMSGQADILANTLLGRWQQMGNEWERAKEQLGEQLAPTLAIGEAALGSLLKVVADSPAAFAILIGSSAALAGSLAWMTVASVYGDQLARLAAILGGELNASVVLFSGSTAAADGRVLGLSAAETTLAETSAVASGSILGLSGSAATTANALEGTTASTIGLSAALPAVAVAMAAWMVGKWVGEITGWTSAIQNLADGHARLKESQYAAEMQQETITRAIKLGAPAGIDYGNALKYVEEKLTGVAAASDQAAKGSTAWTVAVRAGTAAIEAHRIVTDTLTASTRTVSTELARIPAADLATMMQELRDKTAVSQAAFESQAKQMGLSAETVAFLKERVTEQADASKKAAEAVKKHDDAITALRDSITNAGLDLKTRNIAAAVEQLGGVSALTAAQEMRLGTELAKLRDAGAQLPPQLAQLAQAHDLLAKAEANTKATTEEETAAFKRFNAAAGLYIAHLPTAIWGTTSFAGSVQLLSTSATAASNQNGALDQLRKRTVDWKLVIDQVVSSLDTLAQQAGGDLGRVIGAVAQTTKNLELAEAANKKWGGSAGVASALFSDQSTSTEKWAAAVQSGAAIANGAMSVWTATTNAGSKAAGAFKGAVSGAEAGAAFGPWGAAIGAAGGAIVGFIRNMTAGRKAVEDFANSFGGFDALHTKLATLGAAGEQMWIRLTQGVDKSNPAAAKAAIDAITKAFADQEAQITQNNDDLGGLLKQLHDAGGSIPTEWQGVLDSLSKQGAITKDNADLMQQLMGTTTVSTAQMEAVAKKYNLSLDQLGPTFGKQKLHESFQELVDDMDVLARGGTDIGAILTKTGTDGKVAFTDVGQKVQDFVIQSQKLGVDLPENMRPWIQSLIDQGLLLDASGNKITDINKLSFGESLETSVQKLVAAIKALIDKISAVPGALDKIPGEKDVDVVFKGKKTGDWPTDTGDTGDTGQKFHSGTAKVLPFYRPIVAHNGLLPDEVPAILQTGEAVLNRRAVAAMGSPAIGALNRGGGAPSQTNEAAVRELRAMREDLAQQRQQSDHDRRFILRQLPNMIEAAIRKAG